MRGRTRPASCCDRPSSGPPPLLWLLLALCAAKAAGLGGRDPPGAGRPSPASDRPTPGGGLFGRGRRQAVRAYVGMESSTPANLERAAGSSQYPWAIVWGPTAVEEGSTDPTAVEPGADRPGGAGARRGRGTVPGKDRATSDGGWVNVAVTPATLRPFLFGRGSQGTDPQVYVTVIISVFIVLSAVSIILKFCWDRNWKQRREVTRNRGVQTEESRQALTGVHGQRGGSGSIFRPYRDSRAQSPDWEPTSPTELEEEEAFEGKGVRFQRN
ncbi:PILR alpha-associated neural protein, partial [Heptranchias perlo]|uniref:PILR alpha-associated neural protein n=1 Tax=Heptranchias perlo TaxID=212740 RepID=UPI003559D16A